MTKAEKEKVKAEIEKLYMDSVLNEHQVNCVQKVIDDFQEELWFDQPDTLCVEWWYKNEFDLIRMVFVDIFQTEKDNPLNGQVVCVLHGVTRDITKLKGKWQKVEPKE